MGAAREGIRFLQNSNPAVIYGKRNLAVKILTDIKTVFRLIIDPTVKSRIRLYQCPMAAEEIPGFAAPALTAAGLHGQEIGEKSFGRIRAGEAVA